jgi:ribonuclease HI
VAGRAQAPPTECSGRSGQPTREPGFSPGGRAPLAPEPGGRPQIANKLLQARAAWREIGGEDLLLRGIEAEWKDGGSEQRLQQRQRVAPYRPSRALAAEFEALLEEEIREGVVKEIQEEEVKWVNPTFLVPKAKSGKFRKILDCRELNDEMKTTHFKMESPETVKSLIQRGDWATSLDVKSAFNHVPVHESLRPYLVFAYKRRFYAYWGMPFGVQHAPRVFTILMRKTIQAARERWSARMVAYMDDILLLFRDQETARTQPLEIAAFLQEMGWTLSEEKCEMEPTQEITFLGWRWDLREAAMKMPTTRRADLMKTLKEWARYAERRTRRPTKELAGLIGSLNYLRMQFPEASMHLKTLDSLKVRAVAAEGWNGYCTPSPALKGDLLWWENSLTINPLKELTHPPPAATMTTDASPVGWGAVLERGGTAHRAMGIWKGKDTQLTSNAKELTAVRRGLQYFIGREAVERNTTLLVRSDNTATVGDINRLSAAGTLLTHLRELLAVARRHGIYLQAVHLPGVQNEEADRLSRLGTVREYYLRKEVFDEAATEFGFRPEVDVFATTPYLRSDIAAEHPRDALRISWSQSRVFLHPPIHLLTKTVTKALREGTRAILIAPQWSGQPWSPALATMEAKRKILGSYEGTMVKTARFVEEGWRLPPGNAVAILLARKTMQEKSSSQDY